MIPRSRQKLLCSTEKRDVFDCSISIWQRRRGKIFTGQNTSDISWCLSSPTIRSVHVKNNCQSTNEPRSKSLIFRCSIRNIVGNACSRSVHLQRWASIRSMKPRTIFCFKTKCTLLVYLCCGNLAPQSSHFPLLVKVSVQHRTLRISSSSNSSPTVWPTCLK